MAKTLLVGQATNTLYDGLLGPIKDIHYRDADYKLWTAREGNLAKVKIAKVSNGKAELIGSLTEKSFDNSSVTTAKSDIAALVIRSSDLAQASLVPKDATQVAPGKLAQLRDLQQQVIATQNQVVQDVEAGACKALNAGCFAAETMLWTPQGYRTVQEILEGDVVYARNEFDPNGPIVARIVEAKFERTGRIFHLHLSNGRLIRTTPEHPFYVDEKGWTEAGALKQGDKVRTDHGWANVEEVFDTGLYETVYNLRVAEDHTYFVGDECWDDAVWAHNQYSQYFLAVQR